MSVHKEQTMENNLAEILHLYNLTCTAILKRIEIFTSFCCQDSKQFWRMQLDFSMMKFSSLKFSDIEKSEIRQEFFFHLQEFLEKKKLCKNV